MDFVGMKRRDLQALCKRHGLNAGGTNAALAARLAAAAALPGPAGAEEEVVVARKGCLKRSAGCDNVGEAKKVSFALESSRGRRKSQVFCSPVVVVAKTRGRAKAAETLPAGSLAAETGGRGRHQGRRADAEVGGGSADEDGVAAAKAGVGAPVRRSRRNSVVGLSAAAEDEDVDRKRKRKSEEQDQDVAVTAQHGVSCRITRMSSLSGAALLPPPPVEKKRGRRKVAGGKNKLDAEEEQVAEAEDSTAAGRKGEDSEPVMQKSAKVEATCRVPRSRAAATTAMPPLVVLNKKRRMTEDVQPDVELPAVLEVPTNDAPVTRALRSRVVQVNSSVVEETHVAKKLENKGQPSRPATRRNQQLASFVDEEHQEQVAAPSKCPLLRRSGRNNSEASNADSETSKSSSAPVETNDLNIVRPCTAHNAKGECVEKQPAVKEPARRSTRKSVVSGKLEKEVNDLIAEKGPEPEVHARRSKRKSVVLVNDIKGVDEDIQNAKGDDVVKQQAIKEPVRRSTHKSVVSAMLEEEGKDLIAEKSPEAHVRRSKRKFVVPVKGSKGDGEEIQNAEGEDVVKQPAVRAPVRRSTRKSAVSDMLEEEGNDLIAEKSPEAHVRRSKRKSVVPVKGSKGDGEETQNAEGEDLVKQPAVRAPVRRSTRKSVVSDMLEEEINDLIAEKSPEAHVRRPMRKSVVLVKDIKDVGEEIQNAEGEEVEERLVVKQPVRQSTRKSIPSDMLEHENGFVVAETNAEESVSRLKQKSVVPNMLNKENQDDSKKARNEDQSGKAEQTQEHSDIQTDDGLLCETRIGELDQASSITELVPHTGFVSEDETLRDVGEVNFGDKSIQTVNASTGEVGLEDSKTSADIAQVIGSATAVLILDAEAPIDEGTTINAQTKQSDAASDPAPPISDSRQEINSDEQSIHDADLGKCLSKDIEGNPLSTNLNSDGAAAGSTLSALDAAKGCSPDERRSSFGLDFLFAEERKESYSGNDKNTAVEVDYGSKPSACVTPSFNMGSDCCVDDENVQPVGYDADKTLDVGQGVAQEEYVAEEKSTDEHVVAGFDVNTKLNDETVSLYMESECILDGKNMRLVADNRDDEQAMVQVQQGAVQDGTLETCSQCSDHECGFPEESVLHSIKNKGCSSSAEESSLGLHSLFLQEGIDDWMEHGALASAISQSKSGVDQQKDCHVQCTVEKTTESEPVSHQYTHLVSEINDCMYMSLQNNRIVGLLKASHEEERVPSSLSDFSVDAKHRKEVNYAEVSCKGEGTRKIFHSEGLNASCEKSCVSVPADSHHGISDTVLSSSPHAPANDSDDVRLGSNLAQLESTYFLDELIPGSNTEMPHQSNEASTGEVGLEGSKTSADNAQVIGSATAVLILDAEAPIDDSITINAETKQSDAASDPALPISDSRQEINSDEQSIHDADLGKCLSKDIVGNPLSTNLNSDGGAAGSTLPALDAAKGCSPDERRSSFGLDFLFAEERKESYSGNDKNTAVEVDDGSKPSACVTPSFNLGSDCCVEDENVQPIGYDADKTLDLGQGVAQEEYVAEEKSTDEHARFDVNTKLNDETVSLYMESECILDEKNIRFVADNCDGEQAMVQVQQGAVAVQDSTLETCSPCSDHECGLPEESVLHSIKNKGCSSSAEESSLALLRFREKKKSSLGLHSLFSQEGIDDWMEHGALASAISQSKSGVDQQKDCHVQHTVEKTTESEPVSHQHTHLVSEINDCMYMSQQNNGIEELLEASHEEERFPSSLSDFSVDANHRKEVNYVEVSCKGEENRNIFHSEGLNGSCEKSCVSVPADSHHGISDTVLSSSPHAPANDSDDVRLGSNLAQLESTYFLDELIPGSNTEVPHQSKEQCLEDGENQAASRPRTNATMDAAIAKNIESGVVLLPAEERSNEELNSKLESSQVVESGHNSNKADSNTSDSGSIACIVGKRISPGSILPKDSPSDHYLRHGILDDFSVEKSLEESAMSEEKVVSNAEGTVENSSFDLATPGYNHKGALFEEVVHAVKNYVGTCSSNPRELLMELQSMSSKKNMDESNLDNLASPIYNCGGDESALVDQQVKVHLDSDLCQLESTDFVDELIRCSSNEVLPQGHKERYNEDATEEQVAPRPCTNDTTEAAPVKYIESGVELLPVEERSDLQDGLSSNKDVRDILDHGSVGIVGKRTPSGSCLPKVSSMDLYPQLEHLGDFSMEKSLEGSTMFGDKSDSRLGDHVPGTIGNPSSGLTTPNHKHKGGLSEELVNTMINYVGDRPSNPRELLMELQSSNENIKDSDPHDSLAFPSAESRGDESTVCNIEKLLDTVVSSELDTYHSPSQDFSRPEGKQGFMKSNCINDRITPAHLSEDATNIERDVVTEEGLCKEKEKRESMPSSNSDILHENSHSKGCGICQSSSKKHIKGGSPVHVAPACAGSGEGSNHLGLLYAAFPCISASSKKHIDEINSKLSSGDTEVLHQDCVEECHEVNEDKVTLAVLEKDLPEAAPGEGEEYSFSCDKDTTEIFYRSVNNNTFHLPKDCHLDSCQKQEFLDDLSVPKCPEEYTNCQDDIVSGPGHSQNGGQQCVDVISTKQFDSNIEMLIEDNNKCTENNEDQLTPGIPDRGTSEAAETEISERNLSVNPAAGTSAWPEEQIKLEGNEAKEHICSYDKDISNLFSTAESVENSKASNSPKDAHMDPSSERDLPTDLPAPRSPEESSMFQNDSISRSTGICQRSRQRAMDKISTKMQCFKVSSTVKGSFTAMSTPHPKQGDSLRQSAAIAFLRNIENTPAVKVGHTVKPNPDRSAAKDSSRRPLQPLSGRPRDH